ncbi:MAG TPA: hypothetical protein VF241_07340 [Propionibacteriaceae bacterium]
MTSTATSEPISRRGRRLHPAPAIAGITYLAVWVVGLAIWPSNLDVASSDSQVIAAYAGHRGQAMIQSLLVHGVAAVALAVVVLTLGRTARHRGADLLSNATVVAGISAAVVSLVQCGLGLVLAGWAVPEGEARGAGLLFAAINRLDGVKMLALAAMAVSAAVLVRRTGVLHRWLGYLGVILAAALVISGIGYLLLINTLALAAYVSGVLLLVWVAAVGISLSWRTQPGFDQHQT